MADTTMGDTSQLNAAISQVSKEVLVGLSISLCKSNPTARAFFNSQLLVNEDDVPIPPSPHSSASSEASDDASDEGSDEEKEPAPKPTTAGSKRSRTRYAWCVNCKEEFDTVENTRKSCSYHWDICSPDSDYFPDHDERCHGPIDTAEMREIYPAGFIYQCCDRDGEEEPCTTDWHREREESMKRQRNNWLLVE